MSYSVRLELVVDSVAFLDYEQATNVAIRMANLSRNLGQVESLGEVQATVTSTSVTITDDEDDDAELDADD